MSPTPLVPKPPIPPTRAHPRCFACSPANPSGLKLNFAAAGEGRVRGEFACAETYEGYPGKLHGGVIATLIDSAMATCLLGMGYEGYTAELAVKYTLPVQLSRTATVEAWVVKDLFPLFMVEGRLVQDGTVRVTASAKFWVP